MKDFPTFANIGRSTNTLRTTGLKETESEDNKYLQLSLESLQSIDDSTPACEVVRRMFEFASADKENESPQSEDGEFDYLQSFECSVSTDSLADIPGKRLSVSHCYNSGSGSSHSLLQNIDSPVIHRKTKKGKMNALMGDGQQEFLEEVRNTAHIKFVIPQTTKIGEVVAGTKDALVDRLIHEEYADLNFKVTFLMTYRAFLKPSELVSYLMSRFWQLSYSDFSQALKADKFEESEYTKKDCLEKLEGILGIPEDKGTQGNRIVSVLTSWLDRTKIYDDAKLYNDPIFIAKVKIFLSAIAKHGDVTQAGAAEQLLATVCRQSNPEFSKTVRKEYKLPSADHFNQELGQLESSVFAIIRNGKDKEIQKLAEHMTIIDFTLFSQIQPEECLHQAWMSNDDRAKNILAVTSRFNRVSAWVVTCVLAGVTPSDRGAMISGFLTLAGKFMALHNLNGVLEILSGLGSSSISRLYKSWEKVKKEKVCLFEEITNLMSPAQSYKEYRHHIESLKRPCVPYIGVYLSDITFIEEGNTDLIEYPDDASGLTLVHFEKFRLISRVIYDMRRYIDVGYELDCDEDFLYDIMAMHIPDVSETVLYELSLLYEPRSSSKPSSVNERKEKLSKEAKDFMLDLEALSSKKRKASRLNEVKESSKKESLQQDPALFGSQVVRIFLQDNVKKINYYRTLALDPAQRAEDVIRIVLEKGKY